MAINIKDPETDRLVRELARETGESLTIAIATATRERLERVRGAVPHVQRAQAMHAIADRCAAMQVLDARPADEILGYDARGLPA